MKFTCNQVTLTKALNTVSKAVSNKTTLNILRGFLLKVTEEGYLILTASDLDLSIEKKIEVENYEPGSVVVMARLFGDYIRRLPSNSNVTVEEKEQGNIFIKAGESEFKIAGLSADDFPAIGEIEGPKDELVINKEVLKEMIRKTSFSASVDESKGIIVGVLLEKKLDSFNMVALDGFRMAICKSNIKSEKENSLIITAKILNDLNKILSDIEEENDVNILFSKKRALIEIENTKVVIRLLEGEYIKYADIIPKTHKCRAVINTAELTDAIERASLLAKEGKNNLIRMKIEENSIVITSRSEEGNVKEVVFAEIEGEGLEIGFNSKYILDVLKVAEEEKIIMDFIASVNPCLIKSYEEDKYEYLVLPVRISNIG
jgi:DNA polymerase-3 subunit beta